jgi:WD40 repeat protein
LFSLSGHEARVNDVAFNPDGTRLATAGEDNTARLWDATTGQELLLLSGHTERSYDWSHNGINDLAFSPDGGRLATAGVDGQAKVWNVESGEELLSLAGHPDDRGITSVDYGPDGKLLATGTDKPSVVKVWDAETGEELFTLPGYETNRIWAIAISPDGNHLAITNNTGGLDVWQLPDEIGASGEQAPQELFSNPAAHSSIIRSIFYSQDGTRFVTASNDGSAKVWDAMTGLPLLTLSHLGPLGGADFSPDGTRLAIAGLDGIARIFVVDLEELKTLAQSRVTRVLTTTECQQYLHLEECPRDE